MASEGRPALARRLLRGLNKSATGNAQAFGFSITVTVTFGVLAARQPSPTTAELFAFAMSAVAAFSLLNVVVAQLIRVQPDEVTSRRVILLSTATDFLAVAAAIGCALALRGLTSGLVRWSLAPLTAGLAYVIVQSIELTVGQEEAKESADSSESSESSES